MHAVIKPAGTQVQRFLYSNMLAGDMTAPLSALPVLKVAAHLYIFDFGLLLMLAFQMLIERWELLHSLQGSSDPYVTWADLQHPACHHPQTSRPASLALADCWHPLLLC